jgi:hypothetical protein
MGALCVQRPGHDHRRLSGREEAQLRVLYLGIIRLTLDPQTSRADLR